MDHEGKKTEVLVLTDAEGNLYAIPWETLEKHKLSGEGKAWLEKQMGDHGDDVSGYMRMTHGQTLVDRTDTLGAGLARAEEMKAGGHGANKPDTVSMLPITALTGLFVAVQDLSRYIDIPQGKSRLA